MPQTPDNKSPGSHRMRLLERRLAPTTPITPMTPIRPLQINNLSDDDRGTPTPVHHHHHQPSTTTAPNNNNNNNSPLVNPDKPESVQSFASDDDSTPHHHQQKPQPQPKPQAPSPQSGRKARRRGGKAGQTLTAGGGGGGATNNSGVASGGVKKSSKHTPPTVKRRLGRVDEFFKPISAGSSAGHAKSKLRPATPPRTSSPLAPTNLTNTIGGSGGHNKNDPPSSTTTPTHHTHNNNNNASTSNIMSSNINTTTTPGHSAHGKSSVSSSPLIAHTTPITPAHLSSSTTPTSATTPANNNNNNHNNDASGIGSSGATDTYRYLRNMIDTLKKENEILKESVDELRTENEDLQAQVDLELPQLRQSVAEREDEVSRHLRELTEARKHISVLRDALRDASVRGEESRRQAKEYVTSAECERLGKVVVARGGVKNPFAEAWQDGREWKAVSDELASVKRERDSVERRIRRRKRRKELATEGETHMKIEDYSTASGGDGLSGDHGDLHDRIEESSKSRSHSGFRETDSVIQDENSLASDVNVTRTAGTMGFRLKDMHDEDADCDGGGEDEVDEGNGTSGGVDIDEFLVVRAQTLRERESKLREKLSRLQSEREILVREMRRQNDERISQFGHCPTLHGRYVLLDLLGRGGFSEVFRAIDLENGTVVACKIHQLASNWAEDKKRNFIKHAMREYHIHKELNHSRVVRMLDIFEIDDNSFGTVLQFCDGCDLDGYLRVKRTIPEREARAIIAQVFSGLLYLSQPGRRIIHYDLKPANILLSKGKVLITDFGLSKIMGDGESTRDGMELTSQGAGTMWYLPPECFDVASEARINSKVDVWSAGVILFQMLYGRKPFGHDLTQERVFRDKTVQKEDLVFPSTPAVSDCAKDFIRMCLTRRVANRPDVRQVMTHKFLKRTKV